MKIIAYICDNCGCMMSNKEACGLKITTLEATLFNKYVSVVYEGTIAPDKCDIHFCTGCYTSYVTNLIKVDRAKNQELYTKEYNDYSKNFYELLHKKYIQHGLNDKARIRNNTRHRR